MGKKKSAPRTLGEQLEAAILDNPDDLAAQAAYADWLGEQGDPRGELTAVQLAMEEEGLTTERRDELRQREQELLQAHQAVWLGAWAPLAQTTGPEGRGQV